MKKNWKRFWIFCGAATAVGAVCLITGRAMGAAPVVMGNYVDKYMPDFLYSSKGTDSDIGEQFSGIRKLEVETEGLHVDIVSVEGQDIYVETQNVDSRLKLEIRQDEDELKVETTARHLPWKLLNQTEAGSVTIYVPSDWKFDEADLQIGYGELTADRVESGKLQVEVGAGAADIASFTADSAELMAGAGSMTAYGKAVNEVDISCGVGELIYTAAGEQQDYNYDIECGIGELNLGEDSYSGIAVDKKIDNGALKEMKVECGIGTVSIDFDPVMM